MTIDTLPVTCNFRLRAYEGSELVAERVVHNVLTNIGRTWLRNIVGAASYAAVAGNGYIEGTGNVLTSERIRFMAFGVGGSLSEDPFLHTQDELSSVTAVEDYVKIDSTNYMIEVLPQTTANDAFPDNYTIRFVSEILDTQISFAGSTSKSGQVVGTQVPVSEAGLYLSGSSKTSTPDHATNTARLAAYSVFAPIPVNPNLSLRVEWELRF